MIEMTVVITYPANPVAWGESLTPAEGVWSSGTGCGSVYLDILKKVTGDASIQHSTDKCLDYYGSLIFDLLGGFEFDATKPNSKIHFHHAIQANVGFSGQCTIILEDINRNWVTHDYGTSPSEIWEEKTWNLGPDAVEWTGGAFDWTRIKSIIVECFFSGTGMGSFWVDTLHFSYEAEEGTLRIESVPTGQTGTITVPDGTYNFTTPSEITRIVGTEATISIDPTNFVRWEDGSTNPLRSVVIGSGTTTIIAYYETAQLPLLRIASYDQNMEILPAEQGVKIIYKGIEQYIDVPFGGRVNIGEYTLVAVETGDRSFNFWKKPDGTTTTEKYITINVQSDTSVEVHWKIGKKITNLLAILVPSAIVVGLIFASYLAIKR